MHVEGEDGWTVIASQKNKGVAAPEKRKKKNMPTVEYSSSVQYDSSAVPNKEKVFLESDIVAKSPQLVLDFIKKQPSEQHQLRVHVEALGLGDIYEHTKPRLQFYLLKSLLKAVLKTGNSLSANIYDPLFNQNCKKMLGQLPLKVSTDPFNASLHEKADLVIFFLPHCQKQLYEQVIRESTGRYCIIGNSLNCYRERQILLSQPPTAVLHSHTFQETQLPDYESAFNDTYFITL